MKEKKARTGEVMKKNIKLYIYIQPIKELSALYVLIKCDINRALYFLKYYQAIAT